MMRACLLRSFRPAVAAAAAGGVGDCAMRPAAARSRQRRPPPSRLRHGARRRPRRPSGPRRRRRGSSIWVPPRSALVAQAHQQAAGGDYGQATATLERALRIEPDNPLLWIELGRVRLGDNNAAQADGMGHKALALATGDPAAQAAAWRLIADSLRARGRNARGGGRRARARMGSHPRCASRIPLGRPMLRLRLPPAGSPLNSCATHRDRLRDKALRRRGNRQA